MWGLKNGNRFDDINYRIIYLSSLHYLFISFQVLFSLWLVNKISLIFHKLHFQICPYEREFLHILFHPTMFQMSFLWWNIFCLPILAVLFRSQPRVLHDWAWSELCDGRMIYLICCKVGNRRLCLLHSS